MRERLLEWIVCPLCKGSLALTARQAASEGVAEGLLPCRSCGRTYPIRAGVPRLLTTARDPRTAKSFGFEWTRVDVTEFEEDVVTFFRKTGLDDRVYTSLPQRERTYATTQALPFAPDGSRLAGKLILDAGCGMGRYLNVAAGYGGELIGMDVSESVERAARLLAGRPNVHLVQGDLFAPPFRDGTFDFIYSIGCMHHTPDPPSVFRSVAALCRPGGRLAVHVYSPQFWLDPLRGAITKALRMVTVRLPHALLFRLCEEVGLPLGLLQMRLAEHPVGRIIGAPLFMITIPRHRKPGVMVGDTFDTYSARYIHTYTPDDVIGWFQASGFDEVCAMPYPTTVTGQRAGRE